MQQWIVEIAFQNRRGVITREESFYLPTRQDVRTAVENMGGYVLNIRQHERTPLERILARSSWWQVQLLRGIQFRSSSTSPGVALWNLIESETSPRRQNILAPAREALSRGLGAIDALKALNIFDHGTLSILSASERANKLYAGIPHAIQSITQKRKNNQAIMGTLAWLGFDVFTIVQSLFWGKGMIIDWFMDNKPTDPAELEKFERVVGNLQLTWDLLIYFAFAMGAFMAWAVFSYIINRGKKDWPTARMVRKIPLIGGYLRDLGFSDSMAAASRMIKGKVSIIDALEESANATTVPEVSQYWTNAVEQLSRGINLGSALDKPPLTRAERLELATLSDLDQVATIMDAIAEMRTQSSRTKHKLIVWLAFVLTGAYLALAFGSAIYALTVMNVSMDSMMGGLMEGAL